MKVPKIKNRLCPFCRKHTEHKVTQNKKRNPRTLTYGSKYRARRRGMARGTGNLGRYSKPPISKFKRTGAKLTKKTDLRYQCTVCKKKHMQKSGIRAKKVEFV
jgi:large subunit ribosomal protein L44e